MEEIISEYKAKILYDTLWLDISILSPFNKNEIKQFIINKYYEIINEYRGNLYIIEYFEKWSYEKKLIYDFENTLLKSDKTISSFSYRKSMEFLLISEILKEIN